MVVFIVLWGPLAWGGVPAPGFLGIQGLTILALALWLVRLWTQKPFRLLWPPVCWVVLIFLLYALVRGPRVLIEYPARMEVIQIVVYASLFFVIVNNFARRESAGIISFCLIVLGLVLSLFAVYQFATKSQYIWIIPRRAQFLARGSGTYFNPNHLAGLLGMTVPLALAYTLMSRFSSTLKVLFAYCALGMLVGIGVTLSRGGIIATTATLVVFCLVLLFQRGYWIAALGILIALICGAAVFASEFGSVQKRFNEAFKKGQLADARVDYWPAAIQIFKLHPWWGDGPGQFDADFFRYRPPIVQVRPVYAHNDYLNTLADWGATGLAIIAAACAFIYYGAWRSRPVAHQTESDLGGSQKSDRSAFLLGACLGLLAILLHSMTDFNMHIPANAAIAIILMALITGHWRFATERYWKSPGLPGKLLITVAIAAAICWLGAQGMRRGMATIWKWRGADETASFDTRLNALVKAYESEPQDADNCYNLGEYLRLSSLEGNPGYEALARQAMEWYAKGMALNRLDAFFPMRYGMCMDWIGQAKEATPYFEQAEKLDPNNIYVAYYFGRHCVDLGDDSAAKQWFQRSMDLKWTELAATSLYELNQRLADPSGLYKK